MEKNDLLKHIAETGYNVGYTAKLHFASYEMIEKIPGIISVISMTFGIYALAYDGLSTKFISSTLLALGIIGLYVSLRNADKNDYQEKGVTLTNLFNDLKHLVNEVKGSTGELTEFSNRLRSIESDYNNNCASQHIMFATWFAHYKFFWEQQTSWIEEYRKFGFIRDKVPLTLWLVLATAVFYAAFNYAELLGYICELSQNQSKGANE
ncbi:SLATT domain-containing protein [Psychrobium sp. 1_MG-2023]|uniref:SLATT domain-containing protein n=1 Tax=Psychrobium sp. 1_MG-2023 TaxID=3062624 RepID=UPI002733A655|nr:SLATT domain-containing protein [Psychrobium sp. 1_MG-2023]MDP2562782.1 SLATT domain-containing protein [Psychrobium sp. 1_MG-2023]